jgi:hypothetical protein
VAVAESYLARGEAAGTGGDRFQVMIHLEQDPFASDGVFAATLFCGFHREAALVKLVVVGAAKKRSGRLRRGGGEVGSSLNQRPRPTAHNKTRRR